MIEPELKNYLSGINQHLVDIKNKESPGIWRSFFNGMFSAFGYVAGVILVVVLLGWILNKIGVLPEFKKQLSNFQSFMNQAQRLMNVGDSNNSSLNNTNATGTDNVIYLPDGRKVKVVQ